MTLKDHSAQAIFEALMLDPDLDIQEGQTREEAAKQEAEYRARQHWNNMRALALGTGETDFEKSPIRALADFITRPQQWFTEHMPDLLKATIDAVTSSHYYQMEVPESQKLHANNKGESLSPDAEKFLKILSENNMPHQSIEYIKAMAKSYRRTEAGKSNPDGWIKVVSKAIGHDKSFMDKLALPQHGGVSPQSQKTMANNLYKEHGSTYHFNAPAPKASTINKDFEKAGRYGSNSKSDLENMASVESINAALHKMGRDERVELGSTNKLKFKPDTGNVKQWKAYKDGAEGQKRVRIFQNHIDPSTPTPDSPITNANISDYTVAEVLRGFFHHADVDNGKHDVTESQQSQIAANDEAKDEQWEEASSTPPPPEIEKDMTPLDDGEFEFYFGGELKGTQKWDTSIPIKLFHHGVHEEYTSLALSHGLCDSRGYMTPEHVQGIMQAAKAKVLGKHDLVKHTTKSGKVVYSLAHKPQQPDKSSDPNKPKGGLHKYIHHLQNPPAIIPPKTAKKLIENAKESSGLPLNSTEDALDNDGIVSDASVQAILDLVGESQPVQEHPVSNVNHMNLLTDHLKAIAAAHKQTYNPMALNKNNAPATYDSASKGALNVTANTDALKDTWAAMGEDKQTELAGQFNAMVTNFLAIDDSLLPAFASIAQTSDGPWNMSHYLKSLQGSSTADWMLGSTDKKKLDRAMALSHVLHNAQVLSDYNEMALMESAHGKEPGDAAFHVKIAQTLAMNIDDYIQSVGSARDPYLHALHPLALQHLLETVESATKDEAKQGLHPISAALGNHMAGKMMLKDVTSNVDVKDFFNHINNTYGEVDEDALSDAYLDLPSPPPEPKSLDDIDVEDLYIPTGDAAELMTNAGNFATIGHPFNEDYPSSQTAHDAMKEIFEKLSIGDYHPFSDAFVDLADEHKQEVFNKIYDDIQSKVQGYALDSLAEGNGKSYKDFDIGDATPSENHRMKTLHGIVHDGMKDMLQYSGAWSAESQIMNNAKLQNVLKDYINATHGMKKFGDSNPIKSVFAPTKNALYELTHMGDLMSPEEVEEQVNLAMNNLGDDITHASNALGLTDAIKKHLSYAADNFKSPFEVYRDETPLHNWEMTNKPDGPYAQAEASNLKGVIQNLVSQQKAFPDDEGIKQTLMDNFGQAHSMGLVTDDDIAQWKENGLSDSTIKESLGKQYGQSYDEATGEPEEVEIPEDSPAFGTQEYTENKLKEAAQTFNDAYEQAASWGFDEDGTLSDMDDAKTELDELMANAVNEGMSSDDVASVVSVHLTADGADMEPAFPSEPDIAEDEGPEDYVADGEFEDVYEEEDDQPEDAEEHPTITDVRNAAQELNDAVNIGDPDDVGQANHKLNEAKKAAIKHPDSGMTEKQIGSLVFDELDDDAASEHFLGEEASVQTGFQDVMGEPPKEEEPSQVEEELDTVDDAAEGIDRQKAEIMQEVFGRDQDSSDAKKYSKFLDKQKPEKIESLHEKHVIGNIEKKALKAKADKAKQKIQGQKDEEKAAAKEEADKTKADEKQQKEEDKAAQKEADTLPHKSSEIDKKIKEGQDPKQMARENMMHQHQHEDNMSPKTQKDYEEAHNKFEAAGVDMDELISEKDEHGENYGSEEHLQAAMKQDAKNDEFQKNYQDRISGDDYEQVQNRANSFRAGQPGKFTEFDKEGNPAKDLHTKVNQHGESSLSEHGHGEGPEAETKDAQGNDLKSHNIHHDLSDDDKKAIDAVKNYKEDSPIHQAAKKHLEDAGIDLKDVDGPSEDDIKSGPPDPEVARKKMAEGYVWHEETRHWILKDSLKDLQGGMGAHGAAMVHGNALMGKPGQMVKPFAAKEDGSAADSHFVAHQGGVHQVGTPNAKPGGASSHNHIQGAALGHALKDVQPGANGIAHLGNNALSPDGALGKVGLAQAGNHVQQFPQSKSPLAAMGGAMDKLKGMLSLEEIEAEKTAVEKLYVKYK